MDKSKERAYEILRLYLDEAIKLDYITSIILVGSLSDDTYTGGPGSDIDLVHIVSDKADYKAEEETIFHLIERINQQTNHDVPISKVVYQKQQLHHPYQYDFELTSDNIHLINRPIEVFRILDSGKTIWGEELIDTIEEPTREDVLQYEILSDKLSKILHQLNPEWGSRYDEMKKNPTIRILTQSVLTTALSDYYYYTGKNCSSKYRILSCVERDLPDLSYLHLLRLCHKNRFTPDQMTEDDFEEMRREYQTVFLQRPKLGYKTK